MGKSSKKNKLLRNIILVCCLIVFVGSGAYVANYFLENIKAESDLKELSQLKVDNDLEKLYEENSDFVGWLKVDDTAIDYPVMQTAEDPEFYLRRNFDKKYSIAGTPFMDADSKLGETWNCMIYGHHMKSGIMFHDLLNYEDKSFWEDHSTFTFETLDGEETYAIVAACYSQIREKDSSEFKYYNYTGCTDEESFDEFISGIKGEAQYSTGINPVYGDQLMTLSTCAYHVDDGRFYVVGVKVK